MTFDVQHTYFSRLSGLKKSSKVWKLLWKGGGLIDANVFHSDIPLVHVRCRVVFHKIFCISALLENKLLKQPFQSCTCWKKRE